MSSAASPEDGPAGGSLRDSPWDLRDFPVPLIDLSRTFEGFLDLEWLELTPEVARVRFDVRENLKQPLGLLHGGIYSAVAETVASVATVRAVWEEGKIGSGLSNSASFLRPVTAGTVHVSARCRGHDDREWVWGHEFRDDQDRLCALVDVTIAVRPLPGKVSATAVQIDGLPIEVLDLPGTSGGAPLVLLHEGLGSVGLWREFPAQLQAATGRRLIAFSRYGHGHSAPPPRPRTPAFFHEEAHEVLPSLLSALEVSDPVLVGHSDGASIGLIHAAHHPVTALVLLAPHVIVEDICVTAIRGTRELFVSGELHERMARHHDDPDAAFWGWCDVWLDPAFAQWSLEEEASMLRAPTLLIQGAEDPYGTLAQIDLIEARARGPVQRLVLEGGHSPHLEHGPEVAEAISGFLA